MNEIMVRSFAGFPEGIIRALAGNVASMLFFFAFLCYIISMQEVQYVL